MAPIRRFLRISKFNVLECRIIIQNPELAETWLLHPRDPVLPKVLESVRPLIKDKLEEEEQKAKAKSKKSKKATKDLIIENDFECLVFLKPSLTRYDLLAKNKTFSLHPQDKHVSHTNSMTGDTIEDPVDLADDHHSPPLFLQEDSDEGVLDSIPPLENTSDVDGPGPALREPTRKCGRAARGSGPSPRAVDSETGDLLQQGSPQPERSKEPGRPTSISTEDEEKKKMGMTTSYDGFSIYGLTLYLVVTRTSGSTETTESSSGSAGGQAMIKDWIASTQQAVQDV